MGEISEAEQQPIAGRVLFNAVQAKLGGQNNNHQQDEVRVLSERDLATREYGPPKRP
jgi:hypothetical protein